MKCSRCGTNELVIRMINDEIVCIWCYNESEEGEDA